ncbi:FAD:protein FMN transferase [Xylophilus sp. GOD-11R]|uniref:FAD:protein FMN transferase n=1 Tax=Xylophilus sp. GOD-11R TaxID=3089814 RepID=UPI00298CFFE1|nr:FAD:protein FMN transferase [Xylophilus sp. GOD-11R]WPB54952.1 FAD:protein FMN transferase [Xylophilus sp. GOD-11R]
MKPAAQVEPALRRCRPLLGTYVEVAIMGADANHPDAVTAIALAFDAVSEVQRQMSAHDTQSDLTRLNAAPAGSTVSVSPMTAEVLALALEIHRLSAGRFDCGIDGSSIADLEKTGPLRFALRRAVRLDLGGIAKGFAVDRAIDTLAGLGFGNAVVNAGGDMRVSGSAPRAVHIRHPLDPRRVIRIGELCDGASATSASYFRDGRRWLLDPATGRRRGDRRSFTVIASRCAWADALTKVLALGGPRVEECLGHFGAHGIVL